MRIAPLAALLAALWPHGAARACLNDFEIALAEQQLRGAYAAPAAPMGESSVTAATVIAGLGAAALVWALVRAARVA